MSASVTPSISMPKTAYTVKASASKTTPSYTNNLKESLSDVFESTEAKAAAGIGAAGLLATTIYMFKSGKGKQAFDAIANFFRKNPQPVNDLSTNGLRNAADNVAGVVDNVVETVAKGTADDIAQTVKNIIQPETINKEKLTKTAVDIAKEAVDEVVSGASYSKTREAATKNLNKADKDIVKEELKNILDLQRRAEKTVLETSKENLQNAKKAANEAKNVRQGIKKATADELQNINNKAANAAQSARENANKLNEIAGKTPTHKNKLNSVRAENKAIKAELEAKRTEEKVINQAKENIAKAEAKAKNIQEQMASPNYQAGLEKQAQNAKKTMENAERRNLENIRNKPKYKKAYADMQRKRLTPEKILSFMDNPKLSNEERLAAEDLIELLTK